MSGKIYTRLDWALAQQKKDVIAISNDIFFV